MGSNIAWQKHGCYGLGDLQYHEMPFGKSKDGCTDDWNSARLLSPLSLLKRG